MLMYTPAATATTITSRCLKCGTIEKSREMSCCGRGGSWFGTCGSGGNSNLAHTWSEGIRACVPQEQSKVVIRQQLGTAQKQHPDFTKFNKTVMRNSQAVITAAPNTFASTPTKLRTPMPSTPEIVSPTYTPPDLATNTPIRASTSVALSALANHLSRATSILVVMVYI